MKTAPVGLGIWIAFRDRLGIAAQAAAKAVEIGASWVAPRAGVGGLNDGALAHDPAGEIAAYKAAGLRVYPWIYSRPSSWRAEVEAFRRLLAAGADGVLIDAEIEWGGHAADAVAYGRELRAAIDDAWVADCPWPWIGAHPEYPCAEFAAFVDARCAQLYWSEINGAGEARDAATYEVQWAAWEHAHQDLVRPRMPIGVTYGHREGVALGIRPPPPGECTPDDVARFLDAYGSGASLYSLEAASSDVLAMLRARATRTEPAPAPEVAPGAESIVAPVTLSSSPYSEVT